MAIEDSSGTAAQTSVRTTNAGTHKAFIVALLLRVILAGLIHLESLQGTEPPRTSWTASRRVRNRSQPRGLRGIGRKARTESKNQNRTLRQDSYVTFSGPGLSRSWPRPKRWISRTLGAARSG